MTYTSRMLLLAVLLACCTAHVSHAQLVVIDPAVLTQTTVSAVNSVLQVINQVLELTGLPTIALDATTASDLAQLSAILAEAGQIGMDLGGLQTQISTLFNLQTAPASSSELRQRLMEIQNALFLARVYALRVQTLINTLIHTIEHIATLEILIQGFIGNKQGTQTLAQTQIMLNHQQAELKLMLASYHHQDIYERMQQAVIIESLRRMHAAQHADWPGYQP